MPHTSSAKKRLRQNLKRRARNRAAKKVIKIQVKNFLEVLDEGKPEDVRKEFNLTAKKLDQAAGKRVLHPNTVARRKSQLARKLNAKHAPSAPAASPST